MGVNIISPSTLLYEDVQNTLFNQNLLRRQVKKDDIIWQQMTWKHFESLIRKKSLYFKAYSEYDDYDEIKLSGFVDNHVSKYDESIGINKDRFKEILTTIEHKMLVSCWYNSRDLSDVVFKQYTNIGCGVAIGTHVENLIAYLKELSNIKEYQDYEFYAGNIQYIPQKYLDKQALFEETQIIAPIYLKGLQFKMDNEFRICAYSRHPFEPLYNSDDQKKLRRENAEKFKNDLLKEIENPDFKLANIEKKELELKKENENMNPEKRAEHFNIPDMNKLIEYIAIKNDGICAELNDEDIMDKLFKKHLEIKLTQSDMTSSGFRIYNFKI